MRCEVDPENCITPKVKILDKEGSNGKEKVVYNILCKSEKRSNLLGNTLRKPTPRGKNGTAEDFTRHHQEGGKADDEKHHNGLKV